MKLLSCHIENFGKFSDFSLSFSKTLSCFCYENGWGKSTLAAFIRIMFYGFEGERKRSHNERNQFRPWQGGVYGGQIAFECGNKRYQMIRTFGKKESEDTFELRDLDTNLESHDYSSAVGREIFDVDSESFMRTVLISQNDCATAATDDINAKIGNLTSDNDDIGCYEEAFLSMKDYLNRNSPDKKTGMLYKLKEEAAFLETGIRRKYPLLDSVAVQKENISSLKKQLAVLKKEQEEIAGRQRTASRQKEMSGLQEKYREIRLRYEETDKKWEEAQGLFPVRVPEKKELEEAIFLCGRLNEQKGAAEADLYSEDEKGKLTEYEQKFGTCQGLIPKLTDLQEKWSERVRKADVLSMKKMDMEQYRKTEKDRRKRKSESRKKRIRIQLLAGFLILSIGIAVMTVSLIPGICILATGILGLLWGLLIKNKKENPDEPAESTQLRQMEREIRQDERLIQNTDNELNLFFRETGVEFNVNTVSMYLNDFMREALQYELLAKKQENGVKRQSVYLENREKIEKIIQNLGFVPGENLQEQLLDLQERLKQYLQLKERWQEEKRKKELFEQENDLSSLREAIPAEKIENLVVLNGSYEKNREEWENTFRQLKICEERLAEQLEEMDAVSGEEERLKILKEEIQEKSVKYEHIKKAQIFLTEAKENLTARYRDPLLQSYLKYYQLLTGEKEKKYHIDANSEVTVEEYGKQRPVDALSAGYRDLAGLCLRFAFVEAMYRGEKPVMILDDPFVNLDEKKAEEGKNLLKKLAGEFQIVYFTCHRSRV